MVVSLGKVPLTYELAVGCPVQLVEVRGSSRCAAGRVVKGKGKEAGEALVHKAQPVVWRGEEERGGESVPLSADAHSHRGCGERRETRCGEMSDAQDT